ncbi:phenylalanine--tRNA ligase subunit beta [Halobacterium salinarum]|uniref:Phenylalanine--tRNA ligase beta subunit n=1 Tax=Halobacterium salinarum (strain ATCC 33171 / DSM 3754 / JCM 8978 / NBRC 102687 / NCIMB 764 / 91-R6) TaxID=2597657 RepID=A0A4D6GQ59_HALS9|nr:phenylalanine--tRNA ligase subunit beta [Halobacterium salinarum]MCF2207744.1 phenylalanine--tRNA ligase subunit beta [Halobacterium salinarum]MDL0132305.1 phenylalanine--tRNA ligase subunit beta [Halobacterium salinarum]MDL0145226.1 phenylalanine--tRNA ligase subunit beta [Halobacterium salinarum]QCC43824.1 phenylalanine--tRNA ligase beta subunit [Halobacterium salinarum]TYO82319.1 phenylalanyl-tRNA synthetase beta subunit [Halobacterium salinarum DSM 3754]
MPVVDIDPDELRRLTGHRSKDDDELRQDLFGLGIEYEGETEDGEFKLEFEADRLDRLSVEGIARSLRYHAGDDRGVDIPDTNAPEWAIDVTDVPADRPYVTGAVIRGVDLDADALDSLIQLQEKLHATMGRKRAKGAIGIHDLAMLKGDTVDGDGTAARSLTYTGIDPDGDTFVPLDDDAERTPADVLTEHPTGETYADLLADHDTYPAIYDDIGLFSFPPVINGRRTEVTTDSRELFVELTGTDQWTIDRMCAIICYALDARGATIEDVTVDYPDRELHRPDFAVRTKHVSHDRIETLLGVEFTTEAVVDLAERAGLDATPTDDGYDVEIPPYRVDVRHPVDVVDDLGRAYDFNDLTPRYPDVNTIGGRTESSRLERSVRQALVGLGFEDLLNFNMTSEAENFDRMRLTPDHDAVGAAQPATIAEPYSQDFTILRTWALPSLAMVLETNTHHAYPQDLAEVGFAAHADGDTQTGVAERRTVAAVLARNDASYEDAKARLQALCDEFAVALETPPTTHPSFIDGRAATIEIDGQPAGVIGELHPGVIVEHDVEVPVAGFEFELDALR